MKLESALAMVDVARLLIALTALLRADCRLADIKVDTAESGRPETVRVIAVCS